MKYLLYLIPIGLSSLLGGLLVQYFTVHPLTTSLYLAAACLVLFLLAMVLAVGFKERQLLIGIAFSLLFFAIGYVGMTKVFLNRDDPRPVPEITRKKDDPGLGHTAVVYFTHGEPETYNPIGWINQFNEFEEQEIPFVPLVAKPIFIIADSWFDTIGDTFCWSISRCFGNLCRVAGCGIS